MSKYLDLEKLEYNDKVVEIDDDIADTILELNKKGYKTCSCCSGHSKIEFYPFEVPLCKKEEVLKSHDLIYEENDKLYCVQLSANTYIYIKFNQYYDFKNIPNGFEYDRKSAVIGKKIYLWDYDNECYIRPSSIIEKEIKKSNKELFDWAKELPSIQ